MSQLSIWEVRWAIPAAVVRAAEEIGGGGLEGVMKGLRLLAERSGEEWVRLLSRELLADPERVEEILEARIQPDEKLVEKILRSIR